MNINKVKELVVPASFVYEYGAGDEREKATINLKIRRGKLNLAILDKLREIQNDPTLLAPIVAELVAEWDLTIDDEGAKPYLITVENVEALPQDFLTELTNAVVEAATGK